MEKKRKILFLSSEAAPFAKTGGLGDVSGALANALAGMGAEVWLLLPAYRMALEGPWERTVVMDDMKVLIGPEVLNGQISECMVSQPAKVFFVEREDLFDRSNLYACADGEYYDNLERFTYFCRAALLFAKRMDFRPDIIHCNDWQTGLVPAYLKSLYARDPFFARTSSVFTIHNIGYQGLFAPEKLPLTGLSYSLFNPGGLEYYGKIGLLKAGIVYSDAVTTVSPRYSREILDPEFGYGLDGLLREMSGKLSGILNGADYEVWNPATDRNLSRTFSPENMAGKRECKKALIREFHLDEEMIDRPLMGVVSRLTVQKGIDLVAEAVEYLIGMGFGLVLLGEGDQELKETLENAATEHPGKIGLVFGFSDGLAHRIIAGSDLFLVPSRYEPCGLTQMYSLKYGTVPVGRATGGLKDTILPFDAKTGDGNGFLMEGYTADELKEICAEALAVYRQRDVWERLRKNGMAADFSWGRSARDYIDLYEKLSLRFDAFPHGVRAG